jgi:hypothetical protein
VLKLNGPQRRTACASRPHSRGCSACPERPCSTSRLAPSPRQRQKENATHRRERGLAEGHAEVRFSAYVNGKLSGPVGRLDGRDDQLSTHRAGCSRVVGRPGSRRLGRAASPDPVHRWSESRTSGLDRIAPQDAGQVGGVGSVVIGGEADLNAGNAGNWDAQLHRAVLVRACIEVGVDDLPISDPCRPHGHRLTCQEARASDEELAAESRASCGNRDHGRRWWRGVLQRSLVSQSLLKTG